MPANTPNQQITLPVGTDPADAPTGFSDQTADIETRLVQRFVNLADRTARNPAPNEGEVSVLAAENRADIYNGAQWRSLAVRAAHTCLFRAVDAAPINFSTVLVNDGTLLATLDEVGTYKFFGRVYYDASTISDFKLAFTWPAATLAIWGVQARDVTTTTNFQAFTAAASGTAIPAGAVGVGTVTFVDYSGFLTVTATGTLQMQYAQNVADATNLTVRAGSDLTVVKVA